MDDDATSSTVLSFPPRASAPPAPAFNGFASDNGRPVGGLQTRTIFVIVPDTPLPFRKEHAVTPFEERRFAKVLAVIAKDKDGVPPEAIYCGPDPRIRAYVQIVRAVIAAGRRFSAGFAPAEITDYSLRTSRTQPVAATVLDPVTARLLGAVDDGLPSEFMDELERRARAVFEHYGQRLEIGAGPASLDGLAPRGAPYVLVLVPAALFYGMHSQFETHLGVAYADHTKEALFASPGSSDRTCEISASSRHHRHEEAVAVSATAAAVVPVNGDAGQGERRNGVAAEKPTTRVNAKDESVARQRTSKRREEVDMPPPRHHRSSTKSHRGEDEGGGSRRHAKSSSKTAASSSSRKSGGGGGGGSHRKQRHSDSEETEESSSGAGEDDAGELLIRAMGLPLQPPANNVVVVPHHELMNEAEATIGADARREERRRKAKAATRAQEMRHHRHDEPKAHHAHRSHRK